MPLRLQYQRHQYALGTRRPDPAGLRALQDAYAACLPRSSTYPWTQEQARTLGALYLAAWGVVPTARRMTGAYGLPEREAILRLYGSYEAFYAAIRAEGARSLQEGALCAAATVPSL